MRNPRRAAEFPHRNHNTLAIQVAGEDIVNQRRQRRVEMVGAKLHRRAEVPVVHGDDVIVPTEVALQTELRGQGVDGDQADARLR
jgi:hypothetical protein